MSFNVMMVFGARPEAIKTAPLARVLRQWPDITLDICSSGQHREPLLDDPDTCARMSFPRLHAWLCARSAAGNGV
ncbi:hypothetical protein GGI52_004641 [Pseudomonas moraviensis]|uniref:UDP-N-acetylglucosamine 2-epimerase domain-containing protein n=1 Tax=Pseudomonas moraviensis TaxID=321662 RepID=A0A7Z0AWE0_9PSED|nr:hypothetical protein [Pseudomonas moraviensis]